MMKWSHVVALSLMLVMSVASAQNKNQKAAKNKSNLIWTDPKLAAKEDPDFTIQGEYGVDAKGQAWGVQVVALGGGGFDAYLLEGGLPGLGWERGKQRIKLSGKLEGDAVKLADKDGQLTGAISGGKLSVKKGGQALAELPRIERKSATLGAKPPQGALVLFDGKSADAWINGRVENGLLPNSNITTKRKFQDYQLHLEFRTPYKPFARGQGRGNSGVYHQARHETQVLDSFGLEGKQNECGGIYSIAEPRLNMCLPPLAWQTYDVDFTAARFDDGGNLLKHARITVRLNGVLIHENQDLPKITTAAPAKEITPEPGPIYIQAHNNPVYYKNIWLVEK
jgi:hypothetical protein